MFDFLLSFSTKTNIGDQNIQYLVRHMLVQLVAWFPYFYLDCPWPLCYLGPRYIKISLPIAITIGGRSHAATAAASTLLVLFLRGEVLGGCIGWPKMKKNK